MDPTFKGITTSILVVIVVNYLKKWTRLLRGLRHSFASVYVNSIFLEEMDPTFKGITTVGLTIAPSYFKEEMDPTFKGITTVMDKLYQNYVHEEMDPTFKGITTR